MVLQPYDLPPHPEHQGPDIRAREYGLPSAEWVQTYTIRAPSAEYQMINGRIGSLHWDRPYMSVHGWDLDLMLPARASF